jgi:hypothetical protein
MIHPDLELRFINDTIGSGIFAKKIIPAGTITYVKDSLEIEITMENFQRHSYEMQKVIDKYSYIDERGIKIISWDIAKFVNHSCNCNTMSTGYGFEIAIRNIEAGEEVTDEYGLFNIEQDLACMCGASNCRGFIKGTDIDTYNKTWDQKISKILPSLFVNEQPLKKFIDTTTIAQLRSYMDNPKSYRSVKYLKYIPETSKVLK